MTTKLTAVGIAVAALITTRAVSAETTADTNAANTLPTVSVTATGQNGLGLDAVSNTGSRLGLTPMLTPASVSSLSADDIAARNLLRAQDVAVSLPGLSQSPEPDSGNNSLSARGFQGHNSVAQMVDGTRISVAAGTISYPFSTWPLESVEVLSGPASVLYGDGAIGAAVNYVTKRPLFDRTEREVFFSAGSFNTVQGGIGLRGPINEVAAYSVYIDASKSDGQRRDSGYDRQNYSLALALRLARDLNITLSLDGGHNNDSHDYGVPLLDGQLDHRLIDTSFNVGDAEVKFTDDMWRAKLEYQVSEDIQLHNETYYLTSKRHWRNAEDYFYDTPTTVTRDLFLDIGHDEKQTGNRLDATVNGQIGGLQNRFVAGLDAYRTKFLQTTNSPYEDGESIVDPLNVVPGSFDSLTPVTPSRHTTLQTTALFAEDVLSLNAQWKLVAGLRRDAMKLDNTNLRTGEELRKSYSPTTGRLGAVWSLSNTLSFYGQYATGTDPLSGALSLPTGSTNFTLTKGRQLEAGAKGSLPEVRGQWTVAVYRIEKSNLLSQDPLHPDITQQIGKQTSTGIELAVGIEPLRGWKIDANAALLRARYKDFNEEQDDGTLISRSGNTVTGVPERTANVWTSYRVAPQWTTALGAKYVGKLQGDTGNTSKIPSYTLLNGLVTYAYSPRTSLTLSVNNLGNRVYALQGYADYMWLLGDKRNAQLTVRSSF